MSWFSCLYIFSAYYAVFCDFQNVTFASLFFSACLQFVDYFGPEGNGYTTKEIINKLTIDRLKELVEIIHPNDLSNTDALEYGHLQVESIEYVSK